MTSGNREDVIRQVTLSGTEDEILRRISHIEHLDEDALLKKFIREGLARYRLEHAIRAYRRGEINLSQAARHAEVSVEDMMNEMEARGIYINTSTSQFLDGLENLAQAFDGSPELQSLIDELRRQANGDQENNPFMS